MDIFVIDLRDRDMMKDVGDDKNKAYDDALKFIDDDDALEVVLVGKICDDDDEDDVGDNGTEGSGGELPGITFTPDLA